MSKKSNEIKQTVRRLTAGDLDQVVAIDVAHSGRSRRSFFEKRFAAANEHPEDYVQIGVWQDDRLYGFATAQVLRGEFGRDNAIAVLDGLGVQAGSQHHGYGHALMTGLEQNLRSMGIHSLQSQADWTNHDLLRFFATADFRLAPRFVLQRSVAEPMDEPTEDL
jgi:GNAT superfamily N-acetyltransferase